jgi:phosphoenolpyruvate carboxylase
MSYVTGLKCQPRRPSTKRLSPEQLLDEMNRLVDDSNNQIAKAIACAEQWQQVAEDYHRENEQALAQLTEARAEIQRLKKQLATKAGKNKKRWEE